MKTKLYLLVIMLGMVLTSCGEMVATNGVYRHYDKELFYIINTINKSDRGVSKYTANLSEVLGLYQYEIKFLDTVGKYNVGDTIVAEFIKPINYEN